MKTHRLFYLAVTVALVPFALVNLNAPESFTGYALASAFVVHIIVRPYILEGICALSAGFVLNFAAKYVALFCRLPQKAPAFSCAMLGAGSLIVLGWRSSFSPQRDDEDSAKALLQSAILLVLVIVSEIMQQATRLTGPYVLDSYLRIYDQSLGWRSAFAETLIGRIPFGIHFIDLAYKGLPMIAAVICAAYLKYSHSTHWQLFRVIIAAGIIGFFIYLIFPAVGPRYIPHAGMNSLLSTRSGCFDAALIRVPLGVSRNAMPSLHMAWSLLIWLEARELPRLFRAFALSYLVLTPALVLGLGEHYLVDIFVAFPFTLLVLAICANDIAVATTLRVRALIAAILVMGAWLLLLRFGTAMFLFSPITGWSCAITSTAISWIMIHQIHWRRDAKSQAVDLRGMKPDTPITSSTGA